jgi:hypothetical protein
MLKVLIEGQTDRVRLFLRELEYRSQLDVVSHGPVENGDQDQERVNCLVHYHPKSRSTIVFIETVEGVVVRIPFLDIVSIELEEGRKLISGRVFDIFG